MSKFNSKRVTRRTRTKTDTRNLAGGAAHSFDNETELVHAVLSTFLEDKFYEGGDACQERITDLASRVDPGFVAKLAIIARKEHHMRSVSHLLVAALAQNHSGDDLVMRTIIAMAERPDDLTEIAAAVGLPLPKQVKRGLRNALFKFDGHQLAKYRGEGKEISMVDLFNLIHPKVQFASAAQKKAWAALIAGTLKSTDTWENLSSTAESSEERTANWEELVLSGKIGYMALLRNLNNLVKNGVSQKIINAAAKRISDYDEVVKSKQLPFRFMSAYDAVNGSRVLMDAVSEAMDHALDNAPEFSGKTLIAIDTSGSMNGDPLRKASIFAAALAKANKRAEVVVYDTDIETVEVSSRLPIVDAAHQLVRRALGGGTSTDLVFDWAKKSGGYDRIIILSDNESWAGHVQSAYESYRRATGDNPYVFAIDIAGYGTKDVEGGKVYHFTGWSERMFDFMAMLEEGESLVEYIHNYEIPAFVPRKPDKKPRRIVSRVPLFPSRRVAVAKKRVVRAKKKGKTTKRK